MSNKNILLILLAFVVTSCNYNEVQQTSYLGYYDKAQTKLKMKGEIVGELESGLWEYYNEEGKLVQYGYYRDGCQIDKWTYSYPDVIDTSITWDIYSNVLNRFTFSLPLAFYKSESNDTLLFSAINKIKGDIFSIKDCGVQSKDFINTYFEKTKDELSIDFSVIDDQSSLISTNSSQYYFDKFNLQHKATKTDLIMFNLYTMFKNKMLVFAYSCHPEDSLTAKLLLGDIYYHSYYKQERIDNPFVEIKEVLKR